jgi:hypothetical protein
VSSFHMTVSLQMADSDPQNPDCQGEAALQEKVSVPAAWTTVTKA